MPSRWIWLSWVWLSSLSVAYGAEPPRPRPRDAASTVPSSATLKIATFNIQIFGKLKARDPEIVAQLSAIIRKYAVVAIQEIKDVSGEAPKLLLEAVNQRPGPKYALLLSERSGREPNDKASQEQYAFLYDTAALKALSGARLYDDSRHDRFQREPYVARFRTKKGDFSFVLIDIHTRPDSALQEIRALHEVFAWAKVVFKGEDDIIALGDFNASCSYAASAHLDALDLRGPRYFWAIPDSSDSNVSARSACAYDRIVTSASVQKRFTGAWGVDRAFADKRVSDHWPVWAEFRTSTQPRARATTTSPRRSARAARPRVTSAPTGRPASAAPPFHGSARSRRTD